MNLFFVASFCGLCKKKRAMVSHELVYSLAHVLALDSAANTASPKAGTGKRSLGDAG